MATPKAGKKGLSKGAKIGIAVGVILLLGGVSWYFWDKNKKKKKTPPKKNEDIKKKLKDAFDNLTFETNKDVINPTSFASLDELADVLKQEPTWTLKIVGHTDNVGADDFNLELSKKRADAVKKYLVPKGVAEINITTEGKGETIPIAPNETKEGREKNRRVEFVITKADNTITTTVG